MGYAVRRLGKGRGGVIAALAGAMSVACAGESALPKHEDEAAGTTSGSAVTTDDSLGAAPTNDRSETTMVNTSEPPSTTSTSSGNSAQTSGVRSESSNTGSATGSTDGSEHDSSSDPSPSTGSPEALDALSEFLAIPRAERPELTAQAFASLPLSRAQAEQAQALLWQDHSAHIEATRRAEHEAKAITVDGKTLRYDFTVFGQAPATGRSLVLSLHGGGEAEASVNDQQWENQKGLYTLEEGIYLAPRAPTNTWNLWHEAHIDPLFERLIENFIALEGVDPNRVYVMGYSAGGDGVYQLGPRMADHWAAASAMAGHPNEAKPFSLRNIGFTIHVGANDTAFDRHLVAGQWRDQLEMLRGADPDGYTHVVEIHAGKGHWMDLEDAVAVPWMAEFTRNPVPERVVWYQDDILHQRFYWLAASDPVKETTVVAQLDGQHVSVASEDVSSVAVRLRDDMLDLDQALTISVNGESVFEGYLPRTIGTVYRTLVERGDPALVFFAEALLDRSHSEQ